MFASAWNCNRNVIIVVQYIFRLQDYYYYFFLFVLRKLFSFFVSQDVFKTFSRRILGFFKMFSKRVHGFLKDQNFYLLDREELLRWGRPHFILEVNKFLLGYCLQKFVFALVLQFILFVQYSLFLIQLSLEIPRNLFPASIPCLFI